jgi:hypothetical protein
MRKRFLLAAPKQVKGALRARETLDGAGRAVSWLWREMDVINAAVSVRPES